MEAICIDAGGTFFKSALVNRDGSVAPGSYRIEPVDSQGDRDTILNTYRRIIDDMRALVNINEIAGICISTPGPFDYCGHRSLMTHKFHTIKGIDLREEILNLCGLKSNTQVYFLHDVHAFILGEQLKGPAIKYLNIAAITIGTGTGFGMMKNGVITDNGVGGPLISVYKQPYKGGTLEDVASGKGIVARYAELGTFGTSILSACTVAERARSNDYAAIQIFREMGWAIGTVMAPIIEEYSIELLLLGGQVSKSSDLFLPYVIDSLGEHQIAVQIDVASDLENSPLIGAARYLFNMM